MTQTYQNSRTCRAAQIAAAGSAQCTYCPLGTFANANAATCVLCPGGTFKDLEAEVACDTCKNGTYSFPGATACTFCPVGSDLTSSPEGSDSLADCFRIELPPEVVHGEPTELTFRFQLSVPLRVNDTVDLALPGFSSVTKQDFFTSFLPQGVVELSPGIDFLERVPATLPVWTHSGCFVDVVSHLPHAHIH